MADPRRIPIDEVVPIDHLDADQYETFMENRGGCCCFLSPPCSACVDPVTADELRAVGFDDFIDEVVTPESQPRSKGAP